MALAIPNRIHDQKVMARARKAIQDHPAASEAELIGEILMMYLRESYTADEALEVFERDYPEPTE